MILDGLIIDRVIIDRVIDCRLIADWWQGDDESVPEPGRGNMSARGNVNGHGNANGDGNANGHGNVNGHGVADGGDTGDLTPLDLTIFEMDLPQVKKNTHCSSKDDTRYIDRWIDRWIGRSIDEVEAEAAREHFARRVFATETHPGKLNLPFLAFVFRYFQVLLYNTSLGF